MQLLLASVEAGLLLYLPAFLAITAAAAAVAAPLAAAAAAF